MHKTITNKFTFRSKPPIPNPRGADLAGSVTSCLSLTAETSPSFSGFTIVSPLEQLCKSCLEEETNLSTKTSLSALLEVWTASVWSWR